MKLTITALLATIAVLAACQPSATELAEMKETQAQILAKLEDIEKKLDQVPARPARAARPAEDPDKVYDITIGDSPIKGKPDAPVTLVTYSDFQCPFCSRAAPAMEALAKKYPDELKIVYKHFPLSFHAAAKPMALASMAAQEQDGFWDFFDVMVKEYAQLDPGAGERYAADAGLDVARFKSDLEKNRAAYEQRIATDMRQAQTIGVRGTPTLFINGKKVQDRSVTGMSAMVEAALADEKAAGSE